MNASAIGFELGSMGVTISSADARSAVEFAVSGTGTGWALLLMLLPGTLCCGAAALLVALARWLRARKTCSAPEDVAVQPLARDSLAGDASDDAPRPGYGGPASHGSASHGRAAGSPGAVVPVGLEMSLDCTVTNVGTDNMYRTMVVPDLTMVAGLHECTYTLRNSQHGLILLGVMRPGFDPRLDPETNAYDTPGAWLYGEPTLSLLHLWNRHEAIARPAGFHLTGTHRRARFADVKSGVMCHGGKTEPWYGARGAETNDKVKMRLDLASGELEVFLNGESLGVMIEVSGCASLSCCERAPRERHPSACLPPGMVDSPGGTRVVMAQNMSAPLCWMVQLATKGDSVHVATRHEPAARLKISSEE